MPQWLNDALEKSSYFMPHGHCYLWLPGLLWLHVVSDLLIGAAYLGISFILYLLVRKIRLPFSWVFIAFGLFIGLCGLTHFMKVWTVWHPDYVADGMLKAATAAASVATAIGLLYVRPLVEQMVHAARLSDERRLKLEQAHEELEKLYHKVRTLDQQRSDFFANISHELRTPLTLILGPAEQLLHSADLREAQRKPLDSIRRHARILLKQVNDLLDVAKIDAGKLGPRYGHADVAELVRRVAGYFEALAEQRQIRYQIETPAALPAQLDQEMFERVLVNLLSNAFKFTPDAGMIAVSLEDHGASLALAIQDSGPGIEPAKRAAVFERFAQADGEASRTHGGTGLGLAIVRELCELHGGHVAAHASDLGGARLQVSIPRHGPADALVAPGPAAASESARATLAGTLEILTPPDALASLPANAAGEGAPVVLVVEDNPEMRRFIVETLSASCRVQSVSDGAAAIKHILAEPPDLVVSDVMMPVMSGDQLVMAMREHERLDKVPVLLLTARADEALKLRMLRGGAQDYLAKPFDAAELQARAANLIALKMAGDVLRKALASASSDVAGLAQNLAARQTALMVAIDQANVAGEAAKRASQVKSTFLSMVSHELRTPLSTITMNVQLLERDPAVAAAALSSRNRLERVARAAGNMQELVERLLEYIRLESGRIELRIQTVDVLALAHEVLESHRMMTPPEVQLIVEPVGTLPGLVTDLRLLRVILSNLVSNAIKFTSQGSVKISLSHDDGWHVFSVRDSGPGISTPDLARIFLPFEQLASVEHKHVPGFGLGLSLVEHMVAVLGGSISVTSDLGKGSLFEMRLRDAHEEKESAHG